jgi:cell wall-associated NlpC family hydrolase
VVEAARSEIGRDTVLHQDFAGNCFVEPTDRCWSDGTGPEFFDCSGFVIAAMRKVFGDKGQSVGRHVRDFWRAAEIGEIYTRVNDPQVGDMIVFGRLYDIHNEKQVVPGHIGLVSAVGEADLRYIHAATSRNGGRVEEAILQPTDYVLGYVSLADC